MKVVRIYLVQRPIGGELLHTYGSTGKRPWASIAWLEVSTSIPGTEADLASVKIPRTIATTRRGGLTQRCVLDATCRALRAIFFDHNQFGDSLRLGGAAGCTKFASFVSPM